MKSCDHSCEAVNTNKPQLLVQKVVKLQVLCKVALQQSLSDSSTQDIMRKEVQVNVKQDLKEGTPSPSESSELLKGSDVLGDKKIVQEGLLNSEISDSNLLETNGECHSKIKQEFDDSDNWKENENIHTNALENSDSKHNIKKEFDVDGYVKFTGKNNSVPFANTQENIKYTKSSCMFPVEDHGLLHDTVKFGRKIGDGVSDKDPYNLSRREITAPQSPSVKNHCDLNENNCICIHSGEGETLPENALLPINLSVFKRTDGDRCSYKEDCVRIRKRKLSQCNESSAAENVLDTPASVVDDPYLDCSRGQLFYESVFDSEFQRNSPYSTMLRPIPANADSWKPSVDIQSSNSGRFIVPSIDEPSFTPAGICFEHPHQDIHSKIGDSLYRSPLQSGSSLMPYNSCNTLNGTYRENSNDIHTPKSLAPILYSDISMSSTIRPQEITPEQVVKCSCDECCDSTSAPVVVKGCEKYEKLHTCLQNVGSKKLSETLNSHGEELFRRIEKSLAEAEHLKPQEEELLKRIAKSLNDTDCLKCRGELLKKIAKSLNEAECVKCRDEELLKKIEKSLSEAESLKSREERLLQKIEESLTQTGSSRSQNNELLMKIEASLAEAETLTSQEEELLKRIAKSLNEAECLKCRGELLKRIAKSLNEAECLKCREEELLKQIEKSLSNAELLKSREERLLQKIEESLTQTGTSRSQDNELLMKVEASLYNTQYNFSSSTIQNEFELKSKDFDLSLPLKKRKKRLKMFAQDEDVKIKVQGKSSSIDSFPSYPSRPMMSIAELLMLDKLQVPSEPPAPCCSDEVLYSKTVRTGEKCDNIKNDSKTLSLCKSEENVGRCSCSKITSACEVPNFENVLCVKPCDDEIKLKKGTVIKTETEQEISSDENSKQPGSQIAECNPVVDSILELPYKNEVNLKHETALLDEKEDMEKCKKSDTKLVENIIKTHSKYSTETHYNGTFFKTESLTLDEMDCNEKTLNMKIQACSLDCELIKKETPGTLNSIC